MQWFQSLVDHYSEGVRFYHSFSHPAHLFGIYMRHIHEGHLRYNNAVNLAIWWHDAVYDPKATYGENEERSAVAMRQEVGRFEPLADIDLAENLILCTIEHFPDPESEHFDEQATMIDLDLYGLGQPWEKFIANSVDVRRDFGHVDNNTWLAGRIEWLSKFGRRKNIFHGFAKEHEHKARDNLKRELQYISQHGYFYDTVGFVESLA